MSKSALKRFQQEANPSTKRPRGEVSYTSLSQPGPLKPSILLGLEDLRGVQSPQHHDALVIKTSIDGYDVGRCLIDSGSSVDLLSYSTFMHMGLKSEQLQAVKFPLFGFSGNQVTPLGSIYLPVRLWENGVKKTREIEFIVTDEVKHYNAIFDRPLMVALEAAESPFYRCIKFPMGDKLEWFGSPVCR